MSSSNLSAKRFPAIPSHFLLAVIAADASPSAIPLSPAVWSGLTLLGLLGISQLASVRCRHALA